jgi:hypothetical protein
LPRYRHFLPGCRDQASEAAALAVRCDFQLARRLRVWSIMTDGQSTNPLKNNALIERRPGVAGQELRAAVQGLPGRAGEMRPCR